MLRYIDFVPDEKTPPGLFHPGEHETFDHAVERANAWLATHKVKLINLETVVLPNIWSRWEEGSKDASLGTSGDMPSRWHQFVRLWYLDEDVSIRGDEP
ncbi:MAG: hypothetical protein R3C03_06795 [Pirellulaceae bacterium]